VEPCIFTHFAADNIKEKPLTEVLKSPFFRAIQTRQPFSDNLLRPCMLIDEPHVIRDIVRSTGARPTHPGADDLITSYAEAIDDYSAGFKTIADAAWQTTRPPEVPYGTPADVLVDADDNDEVPVEMPALEAADETDVDEAGEYVAAAR
jgi:hypothetical protein